MSFTENPFEGSNRLSMVDLSGYSDPNYPKRYRPYYLEENLKDLKTAEKIVVFPDFSPTEKGKIPTGTAVKFNIEKVPDYLNFIGGADIGCQIRLVRLDLGESGFRQRPELLNKVCQTLRQSKTEVDLGGGNHFLDFVVFANCQMGVLVHTGSFGDQQISLGKLVKTPQKYWEKYSQVISSAEDNSRGVVEVVSKFYGKAEEVGCWIHNTISLDEKAGTVIIRKGVVEAHFPNEQFIIPVSVGDNIILVKPGVRVNADTLWSMPHGSGRKTSRSGAKTFAAEFYGNKISNGRLTDISEFQDLVLPGSIAGLPVTELPFCYNSIEETIGILTRNGLADPSSIKTLRVISCINHL